MKLSILLAGSILTSAIVGNVYAQTCGAQPSCSDLGYSYTGSTSDCVGPALKCPFNTSYFNCTKKADVFNNSVPDLSKGKKLSYGVTHTVTEDGWVQMGAADHKDGGDSMKPYWYINGEKIGTIMGKSDENSALYPVVKGDKVMHNGKATYNYFVFYPNRKTSSN